MAGLTDVIPEGGGYNGLVNRWPDGRMAGIPYDMVLSFNTAYHQGLYAGRPIPKHDNVVNEPDGSTWRYQFSYDNPFAYVYKIQMTPAPADVPGVVPTVPPLDIPGTGISGTGDVPDILNPAPITTTPVTTTPAGSDAGSWFAAAGLIGLAIWAFTKKTGRTKK